jgi:hypothetical protein
MRREASGLASGKGGSVDVSGVREDHRVAVDVGKAEEPGLLLGRCGPEPGQDGHPREDGRQGTDASDLREAGSHETMLRCCW